MIIAMENPLESMYFLLEQVDFHCHVSLLAGRCNLTFVVSMFFLGWILNLTIFFRNLHHAVDGRTPAPPVTYGTL